MAHELTFRNGKADVFSVRESMWHQHGTVLTDAPSLGEAMQLSGTDFEAAVVPNYRYLIGADGQPAFYPNDKGRTVIRTDSGVELGSVGPKYAPIQNATAFQILEPLLDAGIATLETGGSLREGADVWMQARFDLDAMGGIVREVFGDEVEALAAVINNHTGKRGLSFRTTETRIVCANTLARAERGKSAHNLTVRHTRGGSLAVREMADDLLARIQAGFTASAEQYQALMSTILDEHEYTRAVLDIIAPDPRNDPAFDWTSPRANSTVQKADDRRALVRDLWDNGTGHTGNHSAWEAYNSATEALDHHSDQFGVKSNVLESILDGMIGQKKEEVLTELLVLTR